MIHHEDTKGTKAAWGTEVIREWSHHQVVGVVRVQDAFPGTGHLLALRALRAFVVNTASEPHCD